MIFVWGSLGGINFIWKFSVLCLYSGLKRTYYYLNMFYSQATNKFGMTPLHHAAVHGSSDVIKCLLQGGCPVNQADNAGRLPLHWTATKVKIQ